MGSRIKEIMKVFFSLFFIANLTFIFGCSPQGILATGGSTAMVVAEGDRSLGTVVDDATIKINIAAKNLLSTTNSVNSKSSFGGTSPKNAKKIIEYAIKKYLK